nr:MAG TPA: hypothetical protein [Caudoviricetes sp.]
MGDIGGHAQSPPKKDEKSTIYRKKDKRTKCFIYMSFLLFFCMCV